MKARYEGRGIGLRFLEPRRYVGLAGQRDASVALPPGKGSGIPPEFEPRTAQPIASRHLGRSDRTNLHCGVHMISQTKLWRLGRVVL